MLTDASTLSGLDTAFTAKVNAYEVMDYLGFPAGNEQRRIARASIDRLHRLLAQRAPSRRIKNRGIWNPL